MLEAFFSLEVWSLVVRIAACLIMLIMVAGADQGDQENPWIKQTGAAWSMTYATVR